MMKDKQILRINKRYVQSKKIVAIEGSNCMYIDDKYYS